MKGGGNEANALVRTKMNTRLEVASQATETKSIQDLEVSEASA